MRRALGFDFYDIGSVAIEKNFLHLHKLARPSARSYWSFDRGKKAFNHQVQADQACSKKRSVELVGLEGVYGIVLL